MVKLLTEKDIDYLEERLREVFTTKEDFTSYRSEILGRLDEILGEIKDSREEIVLLSDHSKGHTDKIEKLEQAVFAK